MNPITNPWATANLTQQQALARLAQNGWTSGSFFNNDYLWRSDYERHSIPCEQRSSHSPVGSLDFISNMLSSTATLRLYATDLNPLTLLTLHTSLSSETLRLELNSDHLALTFHAQDTQQIFANLDELFHQLETHYTLNLANEKQQLKQLATQYIHDYQQDFPGGNYFLRHKKLTPAKTVDRTRPSEAIRALQKAIAGRDCEQVQFYLEQGTNPNTEFYGTPLISYTLPHSPTGDHEYTYRTLFIFNLLIEYGAQVHHPMLGSLLPKLYYYALHTASNSNHYYILEQMLRIVIRLDNGRCYSYLHANEHPLFKLVKQGQAAVSATLKRAILFNKMTNKIDLKLFEKTFSIPMQQAYCYNQQHFLITTMRIQTIKQNGLLTPLYRLFKNSPPWKDQLTEQQLRSTFAEIISTQGTALVDLVWHKQQLIGYQIADFIENPNGTVTHYIKLALVNPPAPCPGLMFSLQERGFAIGRHFETITAFESASASSYLQLIGMHFFPHIKEDAEKWVTLLKETIYAKIADRIWRQPQTGIYYIKDPLATFQPKSNQDSFYSRTTLASMRFFGTNKTYLPQHSYMVFYINNLENRELYYAKLAQQLETSSVCSIPKL